MADVQDIATLGCPEHSCPAVHQPKPSGFAMEKTNSKCTVAEGAGSPKNPADFFMPPTRSQLLLQCQRPKAFLKGAARVSKELRLA